MPIFYPLILINFKSYREALGSRAIKIAETALDVSKEYGVAIAVAPQLVNLREIASIGVPTFAQHVDPVAPGSWTGHVTLEAIKDAGAVGVIVNHSEKRLKLSDIGFIVSKAKSLDLKSVVCGDTVGTTIAVAMLRPSMVAIEPPELIGTGRAVSRVSPDSIVRAVRGVRKAVSGVKVLCGAGITNGEDVEMALKLGADGVLLASAVAKADDYRAKIIELAEAVKRFIDRGA